MKKLLLTSVFLLLLNTSVTVFAVDGVSVDLGGGDESTTLVGVSAKWNWDSKWFTDGDWYVGGYWELGAGHWNGKSGRERNDSITHVGITPVFRLTKHQTSANGTKPFFEAAVGAHIMSDDKIGDKDLGGNFIFGDQISGGVQFGNNLQHELALRLQHYSNAGLSSSNPGINFLGLRYTYNLD